MTDSFKTLIVGGYFSDPRTEAGVFVNNADLDRTNVAGINDVGSSTGYYYYHTPDNPSGDIYVITGSPEYKSSTRYPATGIGIYITGDVVSTYKGATTSSPY